MKKILLLAVALAFSLTSIAQEKKSKTYKQHKSAESGRYVTKKEAKEKPSTTYSTNRKRSKN
ncbi:hypothetical protein [Flavobacterium sp.]|uniref:hypothetical protein n=1 Tax=Flavobacterium sp. TaxID=239 RepID=UPI004047C5BE